MCVYVCICIYIYIYVYYIVGISSKGERFMGILRKATFLPRNWSGRKLALPINATRRGHKILKMASQRRRVEVEFFCENCDCFLSLSSVSYYIPRTE